MRVCGCACTCVCQSVSVCVWMGVGCGCVWRDHRRRCHSGPVLLSATGSDNIRPLSRICSVEDHEPSREKCMSKATTQQQHLRKEPVPAYAFVARSPGTSSSITVPFNQAACGSRGVMDFVLRLEDGYEGLSCLNAAARLLQHALHYGNAGEAYVPMAFRATALNSEFSASQERISQVRQRWRALKEFCPESCASRTGFIHSGSDGMECGVRERRAPSARSNPSLNLATALTLTSARPKMGASLRRRLLTEF